MSDEIKILCDCGSEKEPAWCNGRLRSNRDGPFRSFAYCEDCDSEIPVPDDNFFSHITGYKHWWAARSLRAQLQEARRQLAEQEDDLDHLRILLSEQAAELERLKNPGATQYCPACVEAQREIAALKAKGLEPIDDAIALVDDDENSLTPDDQIVVTGWLQEIRAKYQGEE